MRSRVLSATLDGMPRPPRKKSNPPKRTPPRAAALRDPHATREAQRYEHPIASREAILEWLEERGRPAAIEAIAQAMRGVGEGWMQVISDFDDPEAEFAMLRRLVEQSGRPMTFSLLQREQRPKLWRELKPGTRVVSNSFSMGDEWPPLKAEAVGTFFVYFWTVPKR